MSDYVDEKREKLAEKIDFLLNKTPGKDPDL